jgi:hypothetical protein
MEVSAKLRSAKVKRDPFSIGGRGGLCDKLKMGEERDF